MTSHHVIEVTTRFQSHHVTSYVTSNDVVLRNVTLLQVASRLVASSRDMSCRIMWHQVAPHRIATHHVTHSTSRNVAIMSRNIASHRIRVWRFVMSCRFKMRRFVITSRFVVTSCHLAPRHDTSRFLTSQRVSSHHIRKISSF